jgi:sodium/proline symporter
MFSKLLAISLYTVILLIIAFMSVRKNQSTADYMVGGRSLNFWLTALAAHASDMSSWFLMGLPGIIFSQGLFQVWINISLFVFMFLNWHFVAPKVRELTEKYNALTFSSFFEHRYDDKTGIVRLLSAGMLLLFFTIYISAGLIGLGILINTFFGVNYLASIGIALCVVIPYLFMGGYTTLAKTDLFQGIFLLAVVLFVPIFIMCTQTGGFDAIGIAAKAKGVSLSLLPSGKTPLNIVYIFAAWGLGYFGQPHIITKFMGIKKVSDMRKAKYVGMSWQFLALSAVTLIGFVGMAYFPNGLDNQELVFVTMVKQIFHPFFAGFILCAVFAATISTIDAQILVLASTLAEDCYKKTFHKKASEKHVVLISRLCVFAIALIAFGIAWKRPSSIFSLVAYAWSGLGATFGPLLLFSLFSKRVNRYGAWAGLFLGGTIAATWPFIDRVLGTNMPPILPGFVLSCVGIWGVSRLTQKLSTHGKTTPLTN